MKKKTYVQVQKISYDRYTITEKEFNNRLKRKLLIWLGIVSIIIFLAIIFNRVYHQGFYDGWMLSQGFCKITLKSGLIN